MPEPLLFLTPVLAAHFAPIMIWPVGNTKKSTFPWLVPHCIDRDNAYSAEDVACVSTAYNVCHKLIVTVRDSE